MSTIDIVVSSPVKRSGRVAQVEGMFDLKAENLSRVAWQVNLKLPAEWNIGAIVGPSGCGKTTIAKRFFPDNYIRSYEWPSGASILDGFASAVSIKDITSALSSVGFSSPPSWLRPYHVLSTGEQFRVTLARALLDSSGLVVLDEFTSTVDRAVAKIGSCALSKAVKRQGSRFVAVSCHTDILDWLSPDWVYYPHLDELKKVRLRRPEISLTVKRVHYSAWQLFRKHHYLNTSLNKSAVCFVAFWQDVPVAFAAYLHFPHPSKRIKREHRTVCLPDYQGVGIGNALSNFVASYCKGLGYYYQSQTSHPAMVQSRNRSSLWKCLGRSSPKTMSVRLSGGLSGLPRKRFQYSFEYVGPSDGVFLGGMKAG